MESQNIYISQHDLFVMLEPKFVLQNPQLVKEDLRKRQDREKEGWVDEFVEKFGKLKAIKTEVDSLRHLRNVITDEINQLKKQGKDFSAKITQAKELPAKIKQKEEELLALEERTSFILVNLPNVLHASVPFGKDSSENVEVRRWGKPKIPKFDLKVHGEFIEEKNLGDFKRAVKVSGAGFAYLKGGMALLDMALQRFAIDHLMQKGFTLVAPPFMMRRDAYEGVTDLAAFSDVIYKIENEDLYMIATSEHPLVAMHKDEVLDKETLPIKYVGVSPCFRKEIGSHGVDTRGLFRMHQFNKVEQVILCKPEDSWKLHEELQKNSEEMLQKLKIPYRVVNICTGDIGSVAAKKYDIEAWFPREKEYREVTSCSNCTAYQAVRLNMKYKKGDEKEYLHTLNNTGIATARVMRAILENFQHEDGSVKIPSALRKYMGGIKELK